MRRITCAWLLMSVLAAQTVRREAVYGEAVTVSGQVVPYFANGYLVYLHEPNRIEVFRPDTQRAYGFEVPCPMRANNCSVASVTVSRSGVVALGIGFAMPGGYTSGIRVLDSGGNEVRFFSTGRYVPMQLAFDDADNLWATGWERDEQINDVVSKADYFVVRKYSSEGTLKGSYLPKSMWRAKGGPGLGGRGYWAMSAATDRVGALFNENVAGETPEWVEWNLNGAVIRRTPLPGLKRMYSRAFDSKGRLWAQFPQGPGDHTELRMLEAGGEWTPARTNLSDPSTGFLLGAEGEELVYRINEGGNVHLMWSRPTLSKTPESTGAVLSRQAIPVS